MNNSIKLTIPATDNEFKETSFEVNFLNGNWLQFNMQGMIYHVDPDWIHRLSNMVKPLTYKESESDWGKTCEKYY
jgi:hypothetical protein